jgi:hypothetical protein
MHASTFGGSLPSAAAIAADKVIRNFIYPWHHVEDIKTAIQWVKAGNLGERVDSDR